MAVGQDIRGALSLIVDCIADLHGNYPKLDGGDLLIVGGDLTKRDKESEYRNEFFMWMMDQSILNYKKVIFIAGNHDNWIQENLTPEKQLGCGEYLCDSGTEFEGLKIWGSPWTLTFDGINPVCKAFTVNTEEELAQKWAFIPEDIDILITHTPPYDILDELIEEGHHAGSVALSYAVSKVRPKLHVFGHIHEAYGTWRPYLEALNLPGYPIFVNASHVNHRYQPINKPIRIEL